MKGARLIRIDDNAKLSSAQSAYDNNPLFIALLYRLNNATRLTYVERC